MGTSPLAVDQKVVSRFYTSASWIEGAAERQLEQVAALEGVRAVAAFPDLHPGRFGPVGMAADIEGLLYPSLVGPDIGCGILLAATGLPVRKLKLDRAVERMTDAFTRSHPDPDMSEGLALGSIGNGNHFCELTRIREIFSQPTDETDYLCAGTVNILVHTGSRSFGAGIFEAHYDENGVRPLDGKAAEAYMVLHDRAVFFAARNRRAVARKAAEALRADFGLFSDVPHNHVERIGDTFRHRKGASVDHGMAVVLGSRGSLSYIVETLPGADPAALGSLAHGAGRKIDRAAARARFGGKGVVERESRNPFGGRVVCGDKNLSAEEAAGAYKPIGQVIDDLEAFGLVRKIASLEPLLTWKTAGDRP